MSDTSLSGDLELGSKQTPELAGDLEDQVNNLNSSNLINSLKDLSEAHNGSTLKMTNSEHNGLENKGGDSAQPNSTENGLKPSEKEIPENTENVRPDIENSDYESNSTENNKESNGDGSASESGQSAGDLLDNPLEAEDNPLETEDTDSSHPVENLLESDDPLDLESRAYEGNENEETTPDGNEQVDKINEESPDTDEKVTTDSEKENPERCEEDETSPKVSKNDEETPEDLGKDHERPEVSENDTERENDDEDDETENNNEIPGEENDENVNDEDPLMTGAAAEEGDEDKTEETKESTKAPPKPVKIPIMMFRNETELEDEEGEKAHDDGEEHPEDLIEIEGEPQIAENPFSEGQEALSATAPGGDPLDEADSSLTEGAVEDSTNGFLDKVNSGTINSSQFISAIVDLPEKPVRGSYKKRKRELSDDDSDYEEEEYTPRSRTARKRKPTAKVSKSKNSRNSKKVKTATTRRGNRSRDALFACLECDYSAETIGELNIHVYGNHDSTCKPTFLDMAEATVAKLADRHGTSRTSLLKVLMEDFGHVVEVPTNTARRILNRSIRYGIELGRIRYGEPGQRGSQSIWLPLKENRKSLLNRYLRNPDSLYVDDQDSADDPEASLASVKNRLSSSNIQVTPSGGSRSTKNSGGRGRVIKPAVDDDEICVVEEKLTPLAKMKAKAYANAKAALAKKLPAAFLKTGATKMVRIGPGGIVRAEGGKIVTTLGKLSGSKLIPIPKKRPVVEEKVKVVEKPKTPDDGDDDDLTCNMCLSSFWYKNELLEHMKSAHNIGKTEPAAVKS